MYEKSHRFGYTCKDLIEISFKLLKVAFYYLSSFKARNIPINIPFDVLYPFTSEWTIAYWNFALINEISGEILL